MKKHRLVLFTLLTMTSLSLSGCSFLFNKNANPVNLDPTRFEKTYNDYSDEDFDPDDHDIDAYYEDYKEEFEDFDDAYDDFEDNPEYWDDY